MEIDDAKLAALMDKLTAVEPRLDEVVQVPVRQRRQRNGLIGLAVASAIFAAGLSVVTYRTSSEAQRNAAAVRQAAVTQRQTCESGNAFRAADLETWNTVIQTFSASPGPNANPAQVAALQERFRKIQAIITTKDAPRKC
jgi:hypothetical protein